MTHFNSLRPRQNECQFADDIFKCIFLNENVQIPNEISLKLVPKGPTNNIPALVQIMVWHQPGDEPLSELMMVSLLMHICVTQPEWLKLYVSKQFIRQDNLLSLIQFWHILITFYELICLGNVITIISNGWQHWRLIAIIQLTDFKFNSLLA